MIYKSTFAHFGSYYTWKVHCNSATSLSLIASEEQKRHERALSSLLSSRMKRQKPTAAACTAAATADLSFAAAFGDALFIFIVTSCKKMKLTSGKKKANKLVVIMAQKAATGLGLDSTLRAHLSSCPGSIYTFFGTGVI